MYTEQEVANLRHLPIGKLREVYERVFGEPTTNRHAQCLIRRIAWRLQANHQGGLSERARQRAADLANEADLRLYLPASRAPCCSGFTRGSRSSSRSPSRQPPVD